MSENKPFSLAYYEALYPRRGNSGLRKDGMGAKMLHQDVLARQRELARRLASAVPASKTETKD